MTKSLKAIIWATIFAGFLTATGWADERFSPIQTALSGTSISGYVDLAIGYFPPQSDTLALLDEAEHSHWSGIAGQVLLVSSTNHTHEILACQSTLSVYTTSRGASRWWDNSPRRKMEHSSGDCRPALMRLNRFCRAWICHCRAVPLSSRFPAEESLPL